MRTFIGLTVFALVLSSAAAGAGQEGAVEGSFSPPDAPAHISAVRGSGAGAATPAAGREGKFRLQLEAGTYTITVSSPVSSFPIRLEDVVVRPGETTVLPSLLIMPGSGKAVLTGRTVPPQPDSEVRLLSEGKERAAGRTDREGRYEFRDLPAGRYEVQAEAPGYARDVAPVTVPENQRVQQTSVLLPIVATDGVDWAAGKIRAIGIGAPPQNAGSAAQARAMAQRAAVADGQRNLLRIIEQIRIDGQRSVRSLLSTKNGTERIQGFIRSCTVVSEREREDGRIEVVVELPLTGPAGLSRHVAEEP